LGYIVCEKCGGYYELQEGEALDDFQSCECGGKLKYVKNLEQLTSKSDKLKKMSNCSFCGTENLKDDKFCGNCGKPLNKTINSKMPPKPKKKITDRLSKYQNKRNYRIFAVGIIGIAFIAFLILWLPGTVFANHYNDGTISFDYPSYSNVTKGQNTSFLLDSGNYEGTIAKVYGGTDLKKDYYDIFITMSPINRTENVPSNQTDNQTNGLNTTNITYTSENINLLQNGLDELKSEGIEPKKSTKNNYTYYEFDGGTTNNKWLNITDQMTIIQKEGKPYFFMILLQSYNGKNDINGYNAYKQIINSFKLE